MHCVSIVKNDVLQYLVKLRTTIDFRSILKSMVLLKIRIDDSNIFETC